MNQINLNGRSFTAPASWEEMTPKQLLIWIKILDQNVEQFDAFKLAVFFFYKISNKWWLRLTEVQRYNLTLTLAFLWDKDKAVNWIIPSVRIWLRKYIGPDNRLSNITIKEYRSCEIYHTLYQRTGSGNYLDMLIATLYRPIGKNDSGNDEREKLNDISIRKNASKMSRLSEPMRQAILFNYEACSVSIRSKYPFVFKAVGKADKSLPDLEAHIKIVSGGKFGSFKETETTPVYLFLDHLNQYIEESEKSK